MCARLAHLVLLHGDDLAASVGGASRSVFCSGEERYYSLDWLLSFQRICLFSTLHESFRDRSDESNAADR